MAKAGMRRPDPGDPHGTESDQTIKRRIDPRVPELEGKAKTGNTKAGQPKKRQPKMSQLCGTPLSGLITQLLCFISN